MSFADEIKLSRGACWLAIAFIVIVNFLFLFCGSMYLGHSSQPELNGVQIKEMRQDVNVLHEQLEDLQKSLANQAIKDAEIKGRDFGYRMGQADKAAGHK